MSFERGDIETEHIVHESHEHVGREHHLRLDDLTQMRKKELLYLPEGVEYLNEKFGGEVEMIFSDVTGMGVANEQLRNEEDDPEAARQTVDDCFALMHEVASQVYGKRIDERPIEMVRVGGDEIMFLGHEGDPRFHEFTTRFADAKKELISERIGKDGYERAKEETNIKAQMKLITKDPEFVALALAGDMAGIRAWLHVKLGEEADTEHRLGDLMRALAHKNMEQIPVEDRLEPLDLYLGRGKAITLGEDPEEVRKEMMHAVAESDAEIAWLKAHPGLPLPKETGADPREVENVAEKYVAQAREVEETIREIQDKEYLLREAREQADLLTAEQLKQEIIRLETRDPGSGGTRFDAAQDKRVMDVVAGARTGEELELARIDVPYFGVYNNHYDYATADELMRSIADIMRKHTQGTILRDGGGLIAVRSGWAPAYDPSAMQAEINEVLEELSNPSNQKKRSAMENEVMVKQQMSRSTEEFGTITMHEPKRVGGVTPDATLRDVIKL